MDRGTIKSQRSSNLELLRIVTMLLIVAHHYVINSGLTNANGVIQTNPMAWQSVFLMAFGAFGKTGINCFVLITGYFMCKSHITLEKFAKLLGTVYFYRLLIWCIFYATGYAAFSIKGLAVMLLPFTSIGDNFTGCYLIFFLLIPFLNVLVQHMNEKQHIRLISLCLCIYAVTELIPLFEITMNYVTWFCIIYLIASYIRLYPKKLFDDTKLWGIVTVILFVLSVGSVVACLWLGVRINRFVPLFFLGEVNKIFAVILALSAFLFFKNLKMKNSRLINAAASSTFGVLLIHAHSDAMREWLWGDVLNNVGMYANRLLVLHAVGSVLGVYVVCTLLDQLRKHTVAPHCMKLWNRIEPPLIKLWSTIEGKILRLLKVENVPPAES